MLKADKSLFHYRWIVSFAYITDERGNIFNKITLKYLLPVAECLLFLQQEPAVVFGCEAGGLCCGSMQACGVRGQGISGHTEILA